MIRLRDKVAVIALLLLFAGMALGTHIFEQLFPVIPLTVVAAMGVILITYYGTEKVGVPIALICLVALVGMVWIYQFPASMLRNDPDRIALWSQHIIDAGSVDAVRPHSSFYADAPLMLLLAALVGIVVDTTARWAFLIWPVLSTTVLPITAAAIASRLWSDSDITVITAILAATFTHGWMYSYGALPQTASVYLWAGFILVGVLLVRQAVSKPTGLAMMSLLFVGSVFAHKISVFVMVAAVGGALAVLIALGTAGFRPGNGQPLQKTFLSLSLISAGLLVIQWEHITGYTDRAVGRILAIGSSPSGTDAPTHTAAVAVNADVLSIVSYSMHIVTGLAVGGLCWLYLARRDYFDDGVVYLLSACAVVTAMAVVAIFAPIANGRIHFFAEPLLAVVIAAGLVAAFRRDGAIGSTKTLAIVVVIGFISIQMFVAPATPDYPGTSTGYLTQSEVDAKLWGEQHADLIHTDQRFERENPPRNIEALVYPDTYQSLGEEVLSGEISDEYACVAYRDGSDGIHAVPDGSYQMTWDFETAVQSEFGQVYSNSDVRQYCR